MWMWRLIFLDKRVTVRKSFNLFEIPLGLIMLTQAVVENGVLWAGQPFWNPFLWETFIPLRPNQRLVELSYGFSPHAPWRCYQSLGKLARSLQVKLSLTGDVSIQSELAIASCPISSVTKDLLTSRERWKPFSVSLFWHLAQGSEETFALCHHH